MTANIAFALSAAVLSLAVVIASALKGHWWVAAVYALLVAGFLVRAAYGRHKEEPDEPAPGPEHEPERRLRHARFRRR
jgi:general stress protein CsbA